ncbi:hypothetical protein [Paenibacillus sp. SI8]
MNTLWSTLSPYWLSIALIVGALAAIWYVYKHKDKLMDKNDSK